MSALDLAAKIIAEFEGFYPDAYRDPLSGNEPITIGYGTTAYITSALREKFKRTKVKLSDSITKAEAEAELKERIKYYEDELLKRLTVPLKDHELAALISFAYNLGIAGSAKQIARLNAGLVDDFLRMLPEYRNKGTNVEAGLLRRRLAEKALFLGSGSKVHELLLERTHKKESLGCELLKLSITGSEFAILVRSGQPWAQVFQPGGPENRPGSMMPLPGGLWSVGPMEWAGGKDNYSTVWSKGLGPLWIGVEPKFKTRRSAIGIHEDGGAYSTAGCIGVRSQSDLKELVAAMRKYDPKTLRVDW